MRPYRTRIVARPQVTTSWSGRAPLTASAFGAAAGGLVVRRLLLLDDGGYHLESDLRATDPNDALAGHADALARLGFEIAEATIIDQLRSAAEGATYGVLAGGVGASPTRKLVAVGVGAGVGAMVGATLGWLFGTPGATYDLQVFGDGSYRLAPREVFQIG